MMKISVFSLWAKYGVNPCGNAQNSEVLSNKEMTVDIAFLSPNYSKKKKSSSVGELCERKAKHEYMKAKVPLYTASKW